ncbi:GspH/FimT family pseudopilin [Kineobactrum salinum]|uniref:Type II secretion system protein H n=1 Tax=Kineobactrum salinum TaxID=2708301 RepID=A0A6C0U2V3_9GAMM|nr:GspH/FimT family pseudopilin [Kineobactrum salinum]QIB66356.1 prepilin-type N-terminal cleavage/methylation domain-containing protein [Kineobactrum salinum]
MVNPFRLPALPAAIVQSGRARRIPWAGEGGFTLVELMIGLVLLAVLLGLGIPSFQSLIANQRIRAISSDLRMTLNTARSEAVKRNRTITVTAQDGVDNLDWSKGWIVASPVAGDPSLLSHTQGVGAAISGPAQVQFSPSGRVAIAGGAEWEIRIAGGATRSSCLTLSVDGRTSSDKGDC